ncbi:MAG: hypothetical protein V1743_06580 [Nanoarchaeota archaeon]
MVATVPEPSTLQGTLAFFNRLGVFDVVLPFILVFTIVFAILQKSKIYGLEKIWIGDKEIEAPRKNLNSMTAFVIAFFVVASSRLVAIINQTLAHTVILLILILCFMMLAGAFHSGKEEFSLKGNWNKFFMIVALFGILLIFLNATGVLGWLYGYILANWSSTVVSSIGLIVIIIVFMLFVTHTPKKEESKD